MADFSAAASTISLTGDAPDFKQAYNFESPATQISLSSQQHNLFSSLLFAASGSIKLTGPAADVFFSTLLVEEAQIKISSSAAKVDFYFGELVTIFPTTQVVPAMLPELEHRRIIATRVNRILEGKTNNGGKLSLLPNLTTTSYTDRRVSDTSVLLFMPLTANAASELASGSMFVSSQDARTGSFSITHSASSQSDRTFRYVIIG